jgi:hypothetical protein
MTGPEANVCALRACLIAPSLALLGMLTEIIGNYEQTIEVMVCKVTSSKIRLSQQRRLDAGINFISA